MGLTGRMVPCARFGGIRLPDQDSRPAAAPNRPTYEGRPLVICPEDYPSPSVVAFPRPAVPEPSAPPTGQRHWRALLSGPLLRATPAAAPARRPVPLR